MTRLEQIDRLIRFDYEQRDILATDPDAMKEYEALCKERDALTPRLRAVPTADEDLARATAYLNLCRRTIRSYIRRMKNGECKMNLSWEMAPHWKNYRGTVRRVLKLRSVA